MSHPSRSGSDSPPALETKSRREREAGFLLLGALLALLVLTALAHATLLLARTHDHVARAEVRLLQGRLAAQSAVRRAASRISPDSASRAVPSGTDAGAAFRTTRSPGSDVDARLHFGILAPEWLLIESVGILRDGSGSGGWRAGAVYWRLDPLVRTTSLRATVEHGGALEVSEQGVITGLAPLPPGPPEGPGACPDSTHLAASFPSATLPATERRTDLEDLAGRGEDGGLDGGPGPSEADALDRVPPLGLLDGRLLARRTGSTGAGERAVVIRGDWAVPPEGARGLVVVGGDVRVDAGRTLVGLLLVGGDLLVQEGGGIRGAARVTGSVEVARGGRIEGSPCAVLTVLEALPDLSRPLAAPGGTWLRLP